MCTCGEFSDSPDTKASFTPLGLAFTRNIRQMSVVQSKQTIPLNRRQRQSNWFSLWCSVFDLTHNDLLTQNNTPVRDRGILKLISVIQTDVYEMKDVSEMTVQQIVCNMTNERFL